MNSTSTLLWISFLVTFISIVNVEGGKRCEIKNVWNKKAFWEYCYYGCCGVGTSYQGCCKSRLHSSMFTTTKATYKTRNKYYYRTTYYSSRRQYYGYGGGGGIFIVAIIFGCCCRKMRRRGVVQRIPTGSQPVMFIPNRLSSASLQPGVYRTENRANTSTIDAHIPPPYTLLSPPPTAPPQHPIASPTSTGIPQTPAAYYQYPTAPPQSELQTKSEQPPSYASLNFTPK